MIVNGKSVRGIYLYDASLEYENGDFVISNFVLYICNPSGSATVKGSDPASDTSNFTPYPGEMATYEDYKNYLSGINVRNKYMSSTCFFDIVQKLCFGLGATGIISKRAHMGKEWEEEEDSIDTMIKSPDFNNGIVLVDREEAAEVIPEIYLDNLEPGWDTVIIRQHSYSFNNGNVMRIQELIDVFTSTMMIRCHAIGSNFISDWTSMNECDKTLALKYLRLKNWYQNRAKYLINTSQIPRHDSFRFMSVSEGLYSNYSNKTNAIGDVNVSTIYTNSSLLTVDDVDYYKSGVFNGTFMLTLIISKKPDEYNYNSAILNYNLTIDLFKDVVRAVAESEVTSTYNLTDSLQVRINTKGISDIRSSNITIELPFGYYLIDAYCRKYSNNN